MTEDIDVKIGTEEEKFWTEIKEKAEKMLKQCEHEIVIQEHIMQLADDKIKKEQELAK